MKLSNAWKTFRPITLASALICLPLLVTQSVTAGTVTGEITARIVIGNGCNINGIPDPLPTPLSFGTLDFGDWISLTNPGSPNIDAATSDATGGGITLECNAAITYNIVVNGGLHAASGTRRMLNGTTASQYVTYGIFSDTTRSIPWVIDTPQSFSVTGTPGTPVTTTHHFYGRVPPQNQATPGTYTDTVQVAISW